MFAHYLRSFARGFLNNRLTSLIHVAGPQQAGVVSVTDASYLPGREAGRGLLPVLPVRRPDMPEAQSLEATTFPRVSPRKKPVKTARSPVRSGRIFRWSFLITTCDFMPPPEW